MAREIDLNISPVVTSPISTNMVAAKSQTLFQIERKDIIITGSGDNFTFSTIEIYTDISVDTMPLGTLMYVDLTSATSPELNIKGVVSILDRSLSRIVLTLPQNGVTDYLGYVNFLQWDSLKLSASIVVPFGAIITYSTNYFLPYSQPIFTFDIHQFVEQLFTQRGITSFEYDVTLSAVNGEGDSYSGDAIATHTINAIEMSLPSGSPHGQNPVGYILNDTILGRPLTAFYHKLSTGVAKVGRLFDGFKPYIYLLHDGADVSWKIQGNWLNVNKGVISAFPNIVANLVNGINKIDLTAYSFTPVSGAKYLELEVVNVLVPQSIKFQYSIYCPLEEQVLIRWKNSFGGWDFWVFDRFYEGELFSNSGLFYQDTKIAPLSEISNTTRKFNAKKGQSYQVNTRGLSLYEFRALQTINQSEFVEIIVDPANDTSFPVSVREITPVQFNSTVNENYSFAMTFDLGNDVVDIMALKTY